MRWLIAVLACLLFGCTSITTDLEELDLQGEVSAVSIYEYEIDSSSGVLAEGRIKDDSHILEYQFNEDGMITSLLRTSPDGDFHEESTYEYDEEGYRKSIQYKNKAGEFIRRETFVWDDGLLTRIKVKGSGRKMLGKTIITYDENGLRLTEHVKDARGKTDSKFQHEYDEDGRRIMTVEFDHTGKKVEVQHFYYGEDGRMVRRNSHRGESTFREEWDFSYEFDEEGNWIKKQIGLFGVPLFVTVRDIEYFE